MPEIRRATLRDFDSLVPLFDAYRQFYRREPDRPLARRFLSERLERNESIIFIAILDGTPCGFTQLFPSFSSGAAARTYILNDLYVAPESRGQGLGKALLDAAADFGRANGAVRLTLATEATNITAKTLYKSNGWLRDTTFLYFSLPL